MGYVILVFGTITLLAGVVILFRPDSIFSILRRHLESLSLHVLAVLVRVILGVVLIAYASESRFPIILEVLGWVSLAAAFILGVIGRSRFKSLMGWALGVASPFARVGGVFAVLFGGFLVYAVV